MTEMVANAIYYLVAHRCVNPDSIVSSQKEQTAYASVSPVGLDLCYDVLDVLDQQKETVIEHLLSFLEKATNRNEKVTFYGVTTYAFESTQWDEFRMFGFSKDHKNKEVQVIMGLLIVGRAPRAARGGSSRMLKPMYCIRTCKAK